MKRIIAFTLIMLGWGSAFAVVSLTVLGVITSPPVAVSLLLLGGIIGILGMLIDAY